MKARLGILALLLPAAVAPAAQGAAVVDLGTTFFTAGITDTGVVAGTDRADGIIYASRWQNGTITHVGGGGSFAGGIANDGTVFGAEGEQFMRWPGGPFGPFKDYGDVSDGVDDVSPNGHAVVSTNQALAAGSHTGLLRPGSSTLEPVPDSGFGGAKVNDNGQMVVRSQDASTFTFIIQGERVPLPGIFPGTRGLGVAGAIVGSARSGPAEPVKWSAGQLTPLGMPAGMVTAQGQSIADDGTVVGYGSLEGQSRGVVWPQGGTPALIDDTLAKDSGWNVNSPTEISANGRYILAYGRQVGATTSAPQHALLLTNSCSVGPQSAIPPAGHLGTPGGWSLDYAVDGSDGLVLQDVKLGERYLARRMSLPYYRYSDFIDGKTESVRGELIADGNADEARSRLTQFAITGDNNQQTLTARYEIDKLPGGACMALTQAYTFVEPIPGDHCEPTGKLKCARFIPRAAYKMLVPSGGTNLQVEIPQRLEFDEAQAPFNSASLMRDTESPVSAGGLLNGIPATSAPIISKAINPLPSETQAVVILLGKDVGSWDNYHQTSLTATSMPKAIAPGNLFKDIRNLFAVPGCPECLHLHWRWGGVTVPADLIGFQDAHGGTPWVPPSSAQDVEIGIVRAETAAEADPQDWRTLANNESLNVEKNAPRGKPAPGQEARLAFWYEARGHQLSDESFIHGAFFGVDDPGKANVTTAKLSSGKVRAGKTATLKLELREWGSAVVELRKGKKKKVLSSTVDVGTDVTKVPIETMAGKRKLKPGRYTLTIRGRDLSGDLSKAKKIGLRIV